MEYIILSVASFLVAVILIAIVKRTGALRGLVDVAQGDALKIHKAPVSYLGGVAMFGAVIASLLGFQTWTGFDWRIGGFILGSFLPFALGFWDDYKWKHISQVRPHLKFALLLLVPLFASFILLWTGAAASVWMGLVAFLAVFILINAVNYQDGMDGLAGGESLISFAGFAVLAFLAANQLALVLSLVLLGAALGFLVFNFPPARIFMGDSGAYFLGFALAVSFLLLFSFDSPWRLLGLVLILGVPVFEGVFTNIRRVIKGQSIFLGDRGHMYDVMLQRGYSVKMILFVFYAAQLAVVTLGVLLSLQFL